MKPSIQTLGQILYSPSQYLIPVFQRNYRWETPQWAQLWESLVEIQGPAKRGNHFMGFLVFVPGLAQPGQHTTFHLIDGQQRLSTSSILLAAVRNIARQLGQAELAEEIQQYYLVHPLKKGDQHFRLLPKQRDRDSYLALVSGTAEPTGRIADALAYFEGRLSDHATGEPQRLRKVFETLCQRFEFMCATLEAENAYNIFKSLNSTGVPLGQSDLIRNFVFMHVAPDEQDEFHRELWGPLEERFAQPDGGTLDDERFSRFFRDFLMADGRYIPPKDTFASFEARYEATGSFPKPLALALTRSASDYSVISGQQDDPSEPVARALSGLNVLESSTTYPLLLALFDKRASGLIDSAQLAHCIEMLRGFILRRFVCGDSSRGYGQMFVRALGKQTEELVPALEAYLLDRGWPDDNRFESAFVEFPLYQRAYAREVLATFERARGHKEPADLLKAQVEHVMPQTLSEEWIQALGSEAPRIHADWLHRLGNLTLSGYNPELLNHPFERKRERYANSNIVITKELAAHGRWGEREIRERGRQLAHEAAQIWIGPRQQPAKLEPTDSSDDEGPGGSALRQRFWRGLSDCFVAEHPELPELEARPSWTIRMPSGLRHIGFELRFGLRPRLVGIDIWFWREASFPLWDRIRQAPDEYNALVDARWEFDKVDGTFRARMYVARAGEVRDESAWPELYRWLGEKLALVYERVAPRLREDMDRGRPS